MAVALEAFPLQLVRVQRAASACWWERTAKNTADGSHAAKLHSVSKRHASSHCCTLHNASGERLIDEPVTQLASVSQLLEGLSRAAASRRARLLTSSAVPALASTASAALLIGVLLFIPLYAAQVCPCSLQGMTLGTVLPCNGVVDCAPMCSRADRGEPCITGSNTGAAFCIGSAFRYSSSCLRGRPCLYYALH